MSNGDIAEWSQTSCINELDLIKEVQKRPILYEKSANSAIRTRLREDAWKEIEQVLQVPETECKKRWRSLRDSFTKLKRTGSGRSTWPYVEAMNFLNSHDNG